MHDRAALHGLQVAVVLTEKDVIRAHARDELGIDIDDLSNPLQVTHCSLILLSSALLGTQAGAC